MMTPSRTITKRNNHVFLHRVVAPFLAVVYILTGLLLPATNQDIYTRAQDAPALVETATTEPVAETPTPETPVTEEPPVTEIPAEEVVTEEPPVTEIPAEEVVIEEPPVTEIPAEEVVTEEPPVTEIPAEEVVAETPAPETPAPDVALEGEGDELNNISEAEQIIEVPDSPEEELFDCEEIVVPVVEEPVVEEPVAEEAVPAEEVAPVVEETPVEEELPILGPLPEDEIPIVEEEVPVVEEPVVEEPVAEEAVPAEEVAPVVEETPVEEELPILGPLPEDEIPIVEEEVPVVEEPVVEEPVAEEAVPAEEVAPVQEVVEYEEVERQIDGKLFRCKRKIPTEASTVAEVADEGLIEGPAPAPEVLRDIEDEKTLIDGVLMRKQEDLSENNEVSKVKLADVEITGKNMGDDVTLNEAIEALIGLTTTEQDIEEAVIRSVLKQHDNDIAEAVLEDKNAENLLKQNVKKGLLQTLQNKVGNTLAQKAVEEKLAIDLEDDQDIEDLLRLMVTDELKKGLVERVVQNNLQHIEANLEDDVTDLIKDDYNKFLLEDLLGEKLKNKPSTQTILVDAVALDEEEVGSIQPSAPVISIVAKGPGGSIPIPLENLHFEAGSVVMIVDPIRKFRPGLYQIKVQINNPITNQTETIIQDFAWGVLAMNMNRDIYQPGDIATINIGVLNDRGWPVCDAEVVLAVETPSGSTSYPKIENTGSCELFDSLNTKPDYLINYTFPQEGNYILKLSATLPNGRTRTMSSKVTVTHSPDFVITRRAATRLYPVGLSPMSIDVYFYKDFDGYISDIVPSDFIISSIESAGTAISNKGERIISDDGKTKFITWKVQAVAGNTQSFRYFYDAPDTSPKLYTVGPLNSSGDLLEKRQWQIASDKQIIVTPNISHLVGHWMFNAGVGNTIYDESSYENDGSMPNMESADWSADTPNGTNENLYSMNFDGTNEHITVPDPVGDELDFGDTDDFTIMGWVSCDIDSGLQALVTKRYDLATENAGYTILRDDTGLLRFAISDGTNVYTGTSGADSACTSSTGWNHFTLVWDESVGADFYLNGRLNNGDTTGTAASVESPANSDPLVFGATADTYNAFDGRLDDIRIYNRVFSTNEISNLWLRNAPGGDASGLTLWLKADEGVTTASNNVMTWADQSGNGNDFTQNTGTYQPKLITDDLNTHDTISFDGISEYFENASFTSNPVTVYGVVRNTNSEANDAIIQTNLTDGNLGSAFNSDGTTFYEGEIAEILFYAGDTSIENLDQRIQSYLAIKYGLTLDRTAVDGGTDYLDSAGNVIWSQDTSDTFENDIAGIGQDNVSELLQTESKSQNSDAVLRVADADSQDNFDFLTWSNNNGEATWIADGAPIGYKLLSRQWQTQEPTARDIGTVDFEFDVADADFDIPALEIGASYYFVYDSNNDGDLSDETPMAMFDDATNGDDTDADSKWTVQANIDGEIGDADGKVNFTIATQVDITAPELSITDITESSDYIYMGDSILYYSNLAETPGTFIINAEAKDPETDIVSVLGSTAFDDTPANYLSPYTLDYSIETSSVCADLITVTATAGSGLQSTADITCALDTDGPIEGTVTYTDDYQADTLITVNVNPGTDAGSGLSTLDDDYYLEYSQAPLADGSCDTYSDWADANVTETAVAASYSFTGLTGFCYQFRYSVRDNVNNQSTFTGTDTVKIDTEAPVPVSMSINAGDNTTNSNQVNLTLVATDEISGLNRMQVSCNNQKWTTPEPFSDTRAFTLTKEPGAGCNSSKGEKTVYARFSDKAGNWGDQAVSDTITYAAGKKPAKQEKREMKNWEKGGIFGDFKPEKEKKELRDATSKHFENPDGSITAVLSTGPMHYKENGEWKEIITDITANDSGQHADYDFADLDNSFKLFYPAKSGNKGTLIDFDNKSYKDWINPDMRWLDADGQVIESVSGAVTDAVVDQNTVTYPLVYKNTDVTFKQSTDSRKVDIVLKDSSALEGIPPGASELAYCEKVVIPKDWTYGTKTDPKNSANITEVIFTNKKGAVSAQYPPPIIYEQNNPDNTIIGRYSLKSQGNALTVCIAAPTDWLTAPNRNFPVVVDPTLNATGTYYTGTVSSSGNKWNTDLDIGCWGSCTPIRRGWARFNLTSVMDGSTFTYATQYIYIRRVPTVATYYVYAYAGIYDPLTATGAQIYSDVGQYVGDYDIISNTDPINHAVSQTFSSTGLSYLTADLSNNWFSTVITGSSTDYARFWQWNYATYYPRLVVTYTTPTISVTVTPLYVNSGDYMTVDGPVIGSGNCFAYWDTNTTYAGSETSLGNLGTDCYSTSVVTPAGGTNGQYYYVCIRPIDGLGTVGGYACDYVYYDSVPPSTPTITCGSFTNNVWGSYAAPTCTWDFSQGSPASTSYYYYCSSSSSCTPGTYDADRSVVTSFAEGTNYFRAMNSDVGGNSSVSTFIVKRDVSAPSSNTISINSAATYTNSAAVTLTLSSTDALSGMSEMQFSCDNTSWTAHEAYSTSKSFNITNESRAGCTATEGTKAVYVEYSDIVGNWSSAVNDTIIYDVSMPTISSITSVAGDLSAPYVDITDDSSTSIRFVSSDNLSGVSACKWDTIDDAYSVMVNSCVSAIDCIANLSGAGAKTVYIRCIDGAGNPMTSSQVVSYSITPVPTVTDANISIAGGSGTGGAYIVGDTVTVTWNNSSTGDNNSGLTAVTADLSGWGGSSTATMTDTTACGGTNADNIYEACYTLVSGTIDTTNVNAGVTATNSSGPATTADTTNAMVDNQPPTVTVANISVTGASGGSGEFIVGDTATGRWDNSITGDNNTDTISMVSFNLSDFLSTDTSVSGSGTANIWTASITSDLDFAEDSNNNTTVIATDNAGNITTTAGTNNYTVDTIRPTITSITSVAGDPSPTYYDTTNDSSTSIIFVSSGANTCKWNTTDVAYASMTNTCASTTNCVTNLSGEGAKTVYIRCIDTAGNPMTTSETVSYTIDSILPSSTVDIANAYYGTNFDHVNTINGTATDATSGISGVELTIQESVSNNYWTGSGWGSVTWLPATSGTTAWKYTIDDTNFTSGRTYTVSARATDGAGNTEATSTDSFGYDTSAPTTSANNSSASWVASSPTITLSTADTGGSGLSYSKYSWDTSDATCRSSGTSFTNGNTTTIISEGSHTLYLCNADVAGNTGSWNGPYKLDTSAPSGGSTTYTNGYLTITTITVNVSRGTDSYSGLSTTDSDYLLEYNRAPLSDGSCGSYTGWTDSAATETAAATSYNYTATTAYCYQFRYTVKDAVGNTVIYTGTDTAKVSTTVPTITSCTVTEGTNPGYQYQTGTTLYYNSGYTGDFAVNVSATDPTGILRVNFPTLATGFTPTSTDDTTVPYSQTYSWTVAATTSPGAKNATVTANNGVNNTCGFTVTRDVTAPTGSSVTCPSAYDTDGNYNVTGSSGSDAGTGVDTASVYFQRRTGTLTANSCSGYGFYSNQGSANAANLAETSLTTGCYEYQYYTVDLVGNSTTSSTCVVKVDTSLPTVSISSVTESSAYIYDNGSTLYYTNVPATPGSFTLNVTAADTDTGITSVSGSTEFGDTPSDTTSAYTLGYSIEQSSTCTTPITVTATANSGSTTNTTRTCGLDTAGPIGGSATYTNGYQNTTPITVNVSPGTDAGSGLSTVDGEYYLEYNRSPLSAGSCTGYTGWNDSAVTETAAASNYVFTGTTGYCYQFRYSSRDHVYNQSTFTGTDTIKIDTAAPTISSITSVAGDTSAPYYDTTDDSSTSIVFASSDATSAVSACKWNTTDVAYASMTNACASTTNCVTNLSGEGAKTVYIRCIDTAGNPMTSSESVSYTVDATPPAVTGITSVAGDTAAIYYDTTDDSSTAVVYTASSDATTCKWNTTDVAYDSMSNTCSSTSSCTLNLSGNGVQTVYMRCMDSAGLKSSSSYTLNYTIDSVAPTITSTTENDADNYVRPGLTITITSDGADATSGINTCIAYWDDNTVYAGTETSLGDLGTDCDGAVATPNSTNGTWYYCVRPLDNVGFSNYGCTNAVIYDETLPTVSGAFVLTANSAWNSYISGNTLWLKSNGGYGYVKATFTDNTYINDRMYVRLAGDGAYSNDGSIVTDVGYLDNNFYVAYSGGQAGTHNITATSHTTEFKVTGNNVSTESRTLQFYNYDAVNGSGWSNGSTTKYVATDGVNPTVTSTTENDADNYVTNGTAVTITSDGADADSGINTCIAYWDDNTVYAGTETGLGDLGTSCDGAVTVPNSTDGTWYLCVRPLDNVGLSNYNCTNALTYDETAPTISANNSSASWVASNPTITLSTADTGGSGLSYSKYSWDTSDATCRSSGTSFTNGNTTTIISEGSHTLYLCNADNIGLTGNWNGPYKLDLTAPTGTSITPVSTRIVDASYPSFTASDGTDTGSGIDTSTRVLERKEATYASNTCGSYGTFSSVTISGTYPNISDNTATGSKCYIYKWSVDDNAGNTTTSSETAVIVRVPMTTITITGGNSQSYGDSVNNPIGYTLPTSLQVQVTDGGTNTAILNDVTVDFAITGTPTVPTATGQTLGSASDNTDAGGNASTTLTFGDRAGVYQVQATSTNSSITVEPTFSETAGQHFALVVTEPTLSINLNAVSNASDVASPTITVTTNAASYNVAVTPDKWPISTALDEILNWATALGFGWDLNSGTITAYSENTGSPALTTVYTCTGDSCQGANVIDINVDAAIDTSYTAGAYSNTLTISGQSISY